MYIQMLAFCLNKHFHHALEGGDLVLQEYILGTSLSSAKWSSLIVAASSALNTDDAIC